MTQPLTIGIIQHSPVYFDLSQSLEKAKDLIHDASHRGAELIVFGETWLSGYPAWLDHCPEVAIWDHPGTKDAYVHMYHSSICVPGNETKELANIARQLGIYLIIGCNERIVTGKGNGTLYNSLITIDSAGQLINHHRKLMPTYTEKLLYGLGDGAGLNTHDTPWGKLGGLICWEHWMPLTRQTMHIEGEHIHVAVWPTVHDMHQLASRHYAFEGKCYVIAVGQMLRASDFPKGLKLPEHLQQHTDTWVLRGGSSIIGPNGQYLLDPQFEKEDIFIYQIPDLNPLIGERMYLDTSGHYNRYDVFDFKVSRKRA